MEHIFNDKPFFAVQFDIDNCGYDVRANDVTVYLDFDPLPITYPINSYIDNSGVNSYSVTLVTQSFAKELAQEGKQCTVKLSLLAQSYQRVANYTKLSTIEYTANPEHLEQGSLQGTTEPGDYFDGLVKVGKTSIEKVNTPFGPGIKITQTVTTPKLNMPHWEWLDGEKIPDNEQTRQELIQQYQKIWNAINTLDYPLLKNMMAVRVKTASESMYQPEEEMSIVNSIHSDTVNGYKIAPFDNEPQHLYLRVMGNGRLAKIYTNNNQSIIFLNRDEQPKSMIYNFEFSKINGKWVVTN